MTYSTVYSYREKSSLDIRNLILILKFILVNAVLACIFLFLTLEEIDWFLFSTRQEINDTLIDDTTWNIKKIF